MLILSIVVPEADYREDRHQGTRSPSPRRRSRSRDRYHHSHRRSRSRSRSPHRHSYHRSRRADSRSLSRYQSRSRSPSRSRLDEEDIVTDGFIRTVASQVRANGPEYETSLKERETNNSKYRFMLDKNVGRVTSTITQLD